MKMKVDLNCPVELFSYEPPKAGFEAVSLLLFNLWEKEVASVQTTLILFDDQGELISRHMERIMGLKGESKSTFVVDVPLPSQDVLPFRIEVVIEKVWFSDNFVWRRSNAPMAQYETEPVTQAKPLEMLKFLAGEDALFYPKEEKHLWVCVCGRANAINEPACRRCGRTHDDVFRNYSMETIQAVTNQREKELEEKAHNARIAASDMQKEREDLFQKNKKRVKRTVLCVASLVVIAGASYGTVYHLLPYLKYKSANELLASGAFDDAKAAFLTMNDYRDAQTLAFESDYQKASSDIALNTVTSLEQAQKLYTSLGDYKDAKAQALNAQYLLADRIFQSGDAVKAAQLYESLGDYKDAVSLAQNARYQDALGKMNKGSYDEAKAAFLALGDYGDAADMAKESVYLPALSDMTLKNYDSAIAMLLTITDYKDTKVLTSKAYYEKANSLYSLDEFQTAGESYLLAGDYLDAKEKAGMCLYEYALSLMTSGDYQAAYELFIQLDDYEKAKEYTAQCAFELGVIALENKELDRAQTYFVSIPDYPGVSDKMNELNYQMALALMTSGDYIAARQAFAELSDYSDSAIKAQEAVYLQGQKAITDGLYEEGIALFNSISSYGDASERASEAALEYAQALVTDGDDEKVIALLGEMSANDENAVQLIHQSRYRLAQSAIESGDYERAITQLEALGNYSDAPNLLKACRFNQAEKLIANGDIIGAAKLYTLAGDYTGAAVKAEAAYQSYYSATATQVKEAFVEADYAAVVTLLIEMDRTSVPKSFNEMLDYFYESNYKIANELYNQGKPYEALPYYRNIPDYKDVASAKLSRNAYRILTKWENAQGVTMVFNDDGTCTIGEEKLYFSVRNYTMFTGVDPDHLTATHRVSRLTATDLTLRDTRTDPITTYRMNRTKE